MVPNEKLDYDKSLDKEFDLDAASKCIKHIGELWKSYTGEEILLYNNSKGETNKRVIIWQWILTNPSLTYDNYSIDGINKFDGINKYGQELSNRIQQLLKYITLDEVIVQRDRLTISGEVKIQRDGYGVIRAANMLKAVELPNKEIGFFYKSEQWKEYIREVCGKLSLFGFRKHNYPLITEFYIEPDFLGTEGKDITFNEIKKSLKENEHKKNECRFLVVGKSGIGKTACLKYLAVLCYRQEICKGYIPIFFSLRRASFLEDQLPRQSFQTFLDIYMSTINDVWGANIKKHEVTEVLRQGKALILIDGLDCDHQNSFYNIKQVQDFISSYPKNIFVISSKGFNFLEEIIFDISEGFSNVKISKYQLKGFNEKQSRSFMEKYCEFRNSKEEKSSSDKNELEKCHNLLVSNKECTPLLLSCLCHGLIKKTENILDKSSHIIEFTKKFHNLLLIEDTIHNFVSGWDTNRNPDFSDPYSLLSPMERIKLLGFLAVRFMQGESGKGNDIKVSVNKNSAISWINDFISQTEFKEYLYQKYLILNNSQLMDSFNFKQLGDHILNSIESQHGLISERFTDCPEISFIHIEIQKYLAAEYLSYIGLTRLDEFLTYGGDWTEIVQQALKLIFLRNELNRPKQDLATDTISMLNYDPDFMKIQNT